MKEFEDTKSEKTQEWRVKTVKDLFLVETGTTPSTGEKKY